MGISLGVKAVSTGCFAQSGYSCMDPRCSALSMFGAALLCPPMSSVFLGGHYGPQLKKHYVILLGYVVL